MNTHHICFSGNLTCSGCNPCERCAAFVRQFVLPAAMVAGGFNQNPAQAQAFFQGYQLGWQRFQQTIVSDPRFMQELKVTDLSPLFKQEERQPSPAPPQMAPLPPQEPPQPSMMTQGSSVGFPSVGSPFPYGVPLQGFPSPPSPNAPFMGPPIVEAPMSPLREPETQELTQKRENEEKERVRNMTTPKESPMKIEEIAAAGRPVDVPNGPTVLGSVMGPGFVPKSQRGIKSDDSGNNGSEH